MAKSEDPRLTETVERLRDLIEWEFEIEFDDDMELVLLRLAKLVAKTQPLEEDEDEVLVSYDTLINEDNDEPNSLFDSPYEDEID